MSDDSHGKPDTFVRIEALRADEQEARPIRLKLVHYLTVQEAQAYIDELQAGIRKATGKG